MHGTFTAFLGLTIFLLLQGVSGTLTAAESGMSELGRLGFAGVLLHAVTASRPAQLAVSGKAAELRLEMTLVPGQPVADWNALNQAAREKGERLPDRIAVATIEATYVDGRTVTTHLRYGESVSATIRDWWNPVDGFVHQLPFAEVVWTRPLEEGGLRHAVVYRMRWPNPRPDVAIAGVVIKAAEGLGEGKLLVFAADVPDPSDRSEATTYFVSPSGDDAAPGTFDQPWATLHKAAATIKAGDTVYVRGGNYAPTHRVAFRGLKAPMGQRTRVIGYPGETATFDFMNALWDKRPEREKLGNEVWPHDQSMIHVFECERFTLSNLHLVHSRARGFGCEQGADNEISYNFVFRTFGPGIRFARQSNSVLVGNTVMRPTSISMAAQDARDAASPLMGVGPAGRRFITGDGKPVRKPPMEGIDSGHLVNSRIAYNEICWGDKECMLIDGDVAGLRIDHNYVHSAHNRPWVWGIAPNGYGNQRDIEIDHNIAHHVGTAFGIGTEGGGRGERVRLHHNLAWDCTWAFMDVTGAWKGKASLSKVAVYNNTGWRNGHLDGNIGVAGGIIVSFPNSRDNVQGSVLHDIFIANNLILEPRDYAQALNHEGDPDALRVVFTHNLTDLAAPSDLFAHASNRTRRPWAGENLIIVRDPVLRDPANRDFRPLPGAPVMDGGLAIGPDGQPAPAGTTSYLGAFGPEAKWVERMPQP